MAKRWVSLVTILSMAFLFGCSKGATDKTSSEATSVANVSSEPITLKVYQHVSAITDAEFKQFIADPVKKKYPNITMELIRDAKGSTINDLLGSGQFPDMMFTGTNFFNDFLIDKLPADLTPLIKKNKFDTSVFEDSVMESIKVYGKQGEMYALPFSTNFSVMVYNKDIFDKFAVSYPKDNMTWDEVINLAKKVSRTENDTQYFGLDTDSAIKFGSGLSLPLIDPKTEKAVINSPGWKNVFNLMKLAADTTGNTKMGGNIYQKFINMKTYAMIPTYGDVLGRLEEAENAGTAPKWDLVSYPSYKEKPGYGLRSVSHSLLISTTSKHQEEAFKALTVIVGQEVQTASSKSGRLSPLKDPAIRSVFGADLKSLKGKHVAGLFISKAAPNPLFTIYQGDAEKILNSSALDYLAGKGDVNTILQNADDQVDKKIAETKTK